MTLEDIASSRERVAGMVNVGRGIETNAEVETLFHGQLILGHYFAFNHSVEDVWTLIEQLRLEQSRTVDAILSSQMFNPCVTRSSQTRFSAMR
jgi:hypothetical protein